ncbi:MAG: PCYCGC motif-containing (lipo)protein [Candidatus Aenigmatarchaeota archaeon]
MKKERAIGLVIIIIFVGITAYFFISSEVLEPGEIPSYVTGEMRAMYEWSNTPEGGALLEYMPCYCGCKFEGHKHTRHCFWRDDGTFDKHGITCSVCLDIAKKTKQMHEEGKDICEIRKEIDSFYAPNVELGTETPMPAGCE